MVRLKRTKISEEKPRNKSSLTRVRPLQPGKCASYQTAYMSSRRPSRLSCQSLSWERWSSQRQQPWKLLTPEMVSSQKKKNQNMGSRCWEWVRVATKVSMWVQKPALFRQTSTLSKQVQISTNQQKCCFNMTYIQSNIGYVFSPLLSLVSFNLRMLISTIVQRFVVGKIFLFFFLKKSLKLTKSVII